MTCAARNTDFFDDNACLIGEDTPTPELTASARRLRETRIAAAVFMNRWKLEIAWRQQVHRQATQAALQRSLVGLIRLATTRRATADGEVSLVTNLPRYLPPLREEIAIWRSFLGVDIHAILFGDD